MDSTRNTTSMVPKSVALGVVALSLVLLSWAIAGQIGILQVAETSDSGVRVAAAGNQASTIDNADAAIDLEQARAIYRQSEHGVFSNPGLVSLEEAREIYRQSEHGAFSNPGLISLEVATAAYRQSERSVSSNPRIGTLEEANDIYRLSEKGR